MSASIFCEHKKLKTACATCRPPPMPKPVGETRVRAKPVAPKATHDDEPAEASRPRGPRRQKAPTRAESEAAEAWWVKKK